MYGLKADAIVGYTFNADQYCPECMQDMAPAHHSGDSEVALDAWAARRGIDRTDEHTFDSDDFPKVIFAVQVEDSELCGQCGRDLIDG